MVGLGWKLSGTDEAPTLRPSYLVRYNGSDAGQGKAPPARCHTFVTDGKIQYLGDCTHDMKGQTVPMEPVAAPDVDAARARSEGE